MPRKKTPEIRIVFDSNALYTKVASDLFSNAIIELINDESSRRDVDISWYLPEVVIKEREYQMQKAADELLPSIEKLEKLLGHRLNITRDILKQRIVKCISEHVEKYNIKELRLDEAKIDWKHLVDRACYRLLPFSTSHEKGFRDSMIAETFFQFIELSPKSTANCKIIFMTQDGDLRKHIEDRTQEKKNVSVLEKIEELKGLINTLASEIDEATIKKYQELAKAYFSDTKNKAGLFYKEKLRDFIEQQYKSQLLSSPPGEELKRENSTTWYISPPQFVKKDRSRVSWSSRIDVPCEIYKDEMDQSSSVVFQPENTLNSRAGLFLGLYSKLDSLGSLSATRELHPFLTSKKKVIVSKGKTIFNVRWSVNINVNKKLTRASINDINCIDTVWEDV